MLQIHFANGTTIAIAWDVVPLVVVRRYRAETELVAVVAIGLGGRPIGEIHGYLGRWVRLPDEGGRAVGNASSTRVESNVSGVIRAGTCNDCRNSRQL